MYSHKICKRPAIVPFALSWSLKKLKLEIIEFHNVFLFVCFFVYFYFFFSKEKTGMAHKKAKCVSS